MRLINTSTLELREFVKDPPPYAILSHRWTDDELSYKDFAKGRNKESIGYNKVKHFCEFVKAHNSRRLWKTPVEWVWVDTCCSLP